MLQARYELDQAAPADKPACRARLEAMLCEMLGGRHGISARELLAATEDEYREYCRQRYLETQRRLSRLR